MRPEPYNYHDEEEAPAAPEGWPGWWPELLLLAVVVVVSAVAGAILIAEMVDWVMP